MTRPLYLPSAPILSVEVLLDSTDWNWGLSKKITLDFNFFGNFWESEEVVKTIAGLVSWSK